MQKKKATLKEQQSGQDKATSNESVFHHQNIYIYIFETHDCGLPSSLTWMLDLHLNMKKKSVRCNQSGYLLPLEIAGWCFQSALMTQGPGLTKHSLVLWMGISFWLDCFICWLSHMLFFRIYQSWWWSMGTKPQFCLPFIRSGNVHWTSNSLGKKKREVRFTMVVAFWM